MRIACDFRNTLGRIVDGLRLVQHRGRHVAAWELLTVTCETCAAHHVLRDPGVLDATAEQLVNCPCGNTVGSRVGDVWIFRHRGRKWLARQVVVIRCEDCGATTRGDGPLPTTSAAAA